MKEKDIELFNKTIHQAKELIAKIVKQKKTNDKAMDDDIKQLTDMVSKLYELFDDLTNGNNSWEKEFEDKISSDYDLQRMKIFNYIVKYFKKSDKVKIKVREGGIQIERINE